MKAGDKVVRIGGNFRGLRFGSRDEVAFVYNNSLWLKSGKSVCASSYVVDNGQTIAQLRKMRMSMTTVDVEPPDVKDHTEDILVLTKRINELEAQVRRMLTLFKSMGG